MMDKEFTEKLRQVILSPGGKPFVPLKVWQKLECLHAPQCSRSYDEIMAALDSPSKRSCRYQLQVLSGLVIWQNVAACHHR